MKRARGFSIVELIVVIVVIAILVTIVVVSYAWMRKDAEVSAYIATIKQIEKGLHLKFTREGKDRWPSDRDLGSAPATSLNISSVVHRPEWSPYLGSLPDVVTQRHGAVTRGVYYDNDNDTVAMHGCMPAGSSPWHGVVLGFTVGSRDIVEAIDQQIDDGNINCGRVRRSNNSGTNFQYILSDNNTL